MTRTTAVQEFTSGSKAITLSPLLHSFLAGLLLPFGFAPFHIPGATILGLSLFYLLLAKGKAKSGFLKGLFFGLGYFGLGTSWIFISINEYGHLNYLISALITLFFLLYLSLFPAFVALIHTSIVRSHNTLFEALLFCALWTLFEYFRSFFLSGFPWLLLGFGQFDAPSKYLLPIIGVLGVSFFTCLGACLLSLSIYSKDKKRLAYLGAFILILLVPLLLKEKNWSNVASEPLSVGIIQANLSMRDKWDESLFWQLLELYKHKTEQLLGTEMIVMPESAIPLPASYISDFLSDMHAKAKQAGSAIMLGIPQPTTSEESHYFNTILSLGKAKGAYSKQHLVPFGEYIPSPFRYLSDLLTIPEANLKPGKNNQSLVKVHHHPIATLICYELAYGDLLRQQLPKAEWIVSISDDGWFGHSLAMYQHQQIAQVRSVETARYQVVANNDGLSSVINTKGEIVTLLPAFSAGVLKGKLFPATGITPWVYFGNWPILSICILIILFYLLFRAVNRQLMH